MTRKDTATLPAAHMRNASADTRYAIEWCYDLPDDGFGGCDVDAAKYKTEYRATEAEAIDRAKELYPSDKFGSVIVTEERREIEPYITRDLGRNYYTWEPVRICYVDDADHVYTERDWQRAGE